MYRQFGLFLRPFFLWFNSWSEKFFVRKFVCVRRKSIYYCIYQKKLSAHVEAFLRGSYFFDATENMWFKKISRDILEQL